MLASIIISLFSIVPALVFWVFVIRCVVKRSSLLLNGIKTVGTIVDWRTHGYFNSKNIDFYYSPIVKFLDDKNEEHIFESEYRTSLGKVWTNLKFSNNKAKIIYRDDNPKDCEIKTFGSIWGIIVTPFLLALLFTIMSVVSVSNLLTVDMGYENILKISLDQVMICVMLLVVFLGIFILWDLFDDSRYENRNNEFVLKEELENSSKKGTKKATKSSSTTKAKPKTKTNTASKPKSTTTKKTNSDRKKVTK